MFENHMFQIVKENINEKYEEKQIKKFNLFFVFLSCSKQY
jgi:hypothetical protein